MNVTQPQHSHVSEHKLRPGSERNQARTCGGAMYASASRSS